MPEFIAGTFLNTKQFLMEKVKRNLLLQPLKPN